MLPKVASEAIVAQLVLQCSFINFAEIGQSVFRAGDTAKGFYWLLSGEVAQEPISTNKKPLRKGDFVGLSEFCARSVHETNYINTKPTEALFIDGKSYQLLQQLLGKAKNTRLFAD